mmetsp:Transcript_66817/g.150927  ORF Transcript_66817/g.150927 Transcript_66817/m.150927 type:complete len:338 (+) Transcript_66817:24-1037(+)
MRLRRARPQLVHACRRAGTTLASLILASALLSHGHDVPCVPEPHQTLSNGVEMPRISFGTAGLPRGEGHESVIRDALAAGFRAFDTARAQEWYDEAALAKALNDSGVPRSQLFVTTKIHPRDFGYEETRAAVLSSLERFKGTIDLVLLHYPRCFPGVCTVAERLRVEQRGGGWRPSWRALTDLHAFMPAFVRAVGVANFMPNEAELLRPRPHVVQSWIDPFRQDRQMLTWCSSRSVALVGYSTLGGQWEHQDLDGQSQDDEPPRGNPVFQRRAKQTNKQTKEKKDRNKQTKKERISPWDWIQSHRDRHHRPVLYLRVCRGGAARYFGPSPHGTAEGI